MFLFLVPLELDRLLPCESKETLKEGPYYFLVEFISIVFAVLIPLLLKNVVAYPAVDPL